MGSGLQIGLIPAGLALSAWMAAGLAFAGDEACRDDHVSLRGDWGQARFSVELADAPETRAKGLMNRESMDRWSGMLFVYDAPKPAAFWMKNTLIPLDMLFVDETGVVTYVHHRAQPHDERPIFGGEQVKAVLEVNGGMAEMLGLDVGTELQHPAFASGNAAWTCPAQ